MVGSQFLIIDTRVDPAIADPSGLTHAELTSGRQILGTRGPIEIWSPTTDVVVGTTGSGSGFKLSGQWLDLYTQSTLPEGTRYWYAPDGATAFSLVGQLAAAASAFGNPVVTLGTLQLTSAANFEIVIA